MNLYDDLVWRGLIDNITSQDLIDDLNKGGLTFYVGVDPTADSLHIGHYSTVIATSKRLADAGHNPIIIAGGGTGLIGDPKPNVERPMISKEAVLKNIDQITKQVNKLFKCKVINNASWLLEMNAIDFLRDYGKYFNINYMIAKDTVKRRLDIGITYTEFSYMLLQSIDFLKLYEKEGCTLQIGGQDQWGNITSGLELIRKIHGVDTKCYGFTVPLITRSDGTKFGKSESGEVLWIDKDRTSSYEMYQYLINTTDDKVIEYLKKLTFLSKEEIEKLAYDLKDNPEARQAQKVLAKEIITFLHGKEDYIEALKVSEALFSGDISELSEEEIKIGFKNIPSIELDKEMSIIDILVTKGITSSKREAKEFLANNAISVNEEKITDEFKIITPEMTLHNKYLIIRRGKKKYYLAVFKNY